MTRAFTQAELDNFLHTCPPKRDCHRCRYDRERDSARKVRTNPVIDQPHDDPPHIGWKDFCRVCCRLKEWVDGYCEFESKWQRSERLVGRVNDAMRVQIMQLHQDGKNLTQIAKVVKVTRTTVWRVINNRRWDGTHSNAAEKSMPIQHGSGDNDAAGRPGDHNLQRVEEFPILQSTQSGEVGTQGGNRDGESNR